MSTRGRRDSRLRRRRGGASNDEGAGSRPSDPRRSPGLKRADRDRLDDIAEAIETIRGHAADRRSDERLRRDALLYNLLILGEAVKALGEETKARRPEIAWRQIAGLRVLLAHEYYRIDAAEIDGIIKHDLGPLESAITALRSRPT
ncbi:MAG: DUF86 domain-containing protein [Chloroflexi bacterium]|nr:MAG: DUF86 domain-containing protein [Chloroflexota bacterium]